MHERLDLWDVTFCTRRFWGPKYLVLLAPANCILRSKFLTHALAFLNIYQPVRVFLLFDGVWRQQRLWYVMLKAHVSIFQDHSDTTHSFCSAFDATMPPQLHYCAAAAATVARIWPEFRVLKGVDCWYCGLSCCWAQPKMTAVSLYFPYKGSWWDCDKSIALPGQSSHVGIW